MGTHIKCLTKVLSLGDTITTSGIAVDLGDSIPLGIIISNDNSATRTLSFDITFDDGTTWIPITANTITVAAHISAGPPEIIPSRNYYPVTQSIFFGIRKIRVRSNATMNSANILFYLGEV
jgi:hypothetical protein